ncbi:hypothetical protein IW140_001500 [Coemansia sp. RSA 1813]|nr:hypothetical protein LPJ74_002260 [Coemansia sp. RSA 1843]KAJ2089568.1 hypothetical protein IW138_003310 [Coemansia sp. RSA 986]KAJ2571582.1 hypothetical protein IW140_001500 [Coemansia sp. RSA 1813]
MSTIRPLTEQTLNRHAHQYDKRNKANTAGTSSGAAALGTMTAAAAAHPRMSETKLELVLNYIENQMNISQGSLPMTEASREFIRKTNSRCGQKAAEQLSTANTETSEAIAQHQQQQQLNRRRREKRASLRKDLHSPTKGTRNELPAAHNGTTVAATTSSHAAVSAHCFGAIHAQPSKKKEPKRHLGIFNKGKAVASKSSGIAFSESEFLKSANVCRIQMECAPNDDANSECKKPSRRISRRSSNGDSAHSGTSQPSPRDTIMPRGFSHWKDIETEIQHAHASSSSSDPCPNDFSARDNKLVPSAPGCSYSAQPEEPIVLPVSPQLPCGEIHCEPTAHDFLSASIDSGALDFDAEAANSMSADSVIAGGMRRPRSQDIAPTRRSRAKLLASIEEYLNQDDKYGSFTPRGLSFGLDGVSDSEGLDISALFDEHNDEGTPRFNSHNFSSTGLSELDSCIFASGDVQGLRHPGNIAISDFGNSRYGPGFHGLDIFALTDQSRGSLDSTDTLPEYMFREELPPPYLSLEDSSHIDRDYGHCSRQYPNYSCAPINSQHNLIRQRPSSWRGPLDHEMRNVGRQYVRADGNGHNRIRRSSSSNANNRIPPPMLGIAHPNSQEEVDFRFFPRHIG